MLKKLYKIVGLGKGWDGNFVEVGEKDGDKVNVLSFVYPDSVIGDRELNLPVPPGGLWINEKLLEWVGERQPKEFDSRNPFGKARFEGRYTQGNLEVAWCRYERALQVTVIEKVEDKPRTRYTNYFFGDDQHQSDVLQEISIAIQKADLDDLIFTLDGLKGSESVNTEPKYAFNGGSGNG